MANIGIIGAGSWGLALSVLLHSNGHQVKIWSFLQSDTDMINSTHELPDKLPDVKIPEEVCVTSDMEEAIDGADLLIFVSPSNVIRPTAQKMKPYVKDQMVIVNAAKGIEEGTMMTMTDILEEEIPQANVAVISGPSHAEEVARLLPTTIVIGAHDEKTARCLQEIFMSPVFRVYISSDMIGIEVGAALKNVIALAAGIADGLGYGDNAKAALITRGMVEISRLGIKMGGKAETFSGLTGIGDLIVTCASMHSRNRRAGILIGRGYSMDEAMKEVNMVVEGVYSAKSALALAQKYDVELPIIEQVNLILFDGKDPREAVSDLMLRDSGIEHPIVGWN